MGIRPAMEYNPIYTAWIGWAGGRQSTALVWIGSTMLSILWIESVDH
jgi:hypothetical protein